MANTNDDGMSVSGALVSQAERVLSETLGGEVRLGEPERLSHAGRRNLLLRCPVVDGPGSAPPSVIIKQASRTGFVPEDPRCVPTQLLLADWAGLQFLSEVAGSAAGIPRIYGGDRRAGFFVMEDLGSTPSLVYVLLCGSAGSAERALVLLGGSLGKMHARSMGQRSRYERIRRALGPGDAEACSGQAQYIRDCIPHIVSHCARLGVQPGEQFFADAERVAAAAGDPGPFLAYTHGDPCLDNCTLVGGRLRLFDFEGGAFRHALRDGVYGRMRFPTCWWVREIPGAVLARMDAVYRQELAQGCPAVDDDAFYQRAAAEACGFWTIAHLGYTLGSILDHDVPAGPATERQRLVSRLKAFIRVAEEGRHLLGLRDLAARMIEQFSWQWIGLPMLRSFDAFARPAELRPGDVDAIAVAVRLGETGQVRALLEKNPQLRDARLRDQEITPLLHYALRQSQTDVAALLLEYGADLHATTDWNVTALHTAAERGDLRAVELLLAGGADAHAVDRSGKTPPAIATEKGHTAVAAVLNAGRR